MIRYLMNINPNQTQVAQAVGVNQSTVSRIWTEFGPLNDTRDAAKALLHNSALTLTERIVAKASPAVALETLDRIDVTVKKQAQGENKSGVTVIIGVKDSDVSVQLGYAESVEANDHTVRIRQSDAIQTVDVTP